MMTTLAGCATTAGVQSKEPQLTLESSKSPDALEECIALNLSKLGNSFTTRGENQRIMAFGSTMSTALTITIVYGAPNTISVRNGIGFLKMHNRWRREIEACT